MCRYVCLHVGVCTEGLVTLEVRDGQFFETAVADSCELCDTGPLEEKQMLLTIEHSLQPLNNEFYMNNMAHIEGTCEVHKGTV